MSKAYGHSMDDYLEAIYTLVSPVGVYEPAKASAAIAARVAEVLDVSRTAVGEMPNRLTADGLWLLCLYARGGLDLRHPLREGATREELVNLIGTVWSMRADRGAEERLQSPNRDVLIPVAALKRDAHLEMHTRGG